MFRTAYDRIRVYTNPGSPMKDEYEIRKDSKGDSVLKKVGQSDLYEYIQSFKDSTDINVLLERFKLTGDPSVFEKKQTFYADVTEFPKTPAEMLAQYQMSKNFFYSLDPDDRAKFNNDPDQFYSAFGTKEFDAIFNPVDNGTDDVVLEKEVNNEP